MTKPEPQEAEQYLASLSPITQEVQQREEMEAARESILSAARRDQDRREGIFEQARVGGRRQAAEGLLQGTRGVEAGTGVQAGLGRQAAADVLLGEQQMAAARAAESPAQTMAELEKNLLAEGQAGGTAMTDRIGKMTSYATIIDSYEPGSAQQDKAIDDLMALEASQASPDWYVINHLNGQRSALNPQYNIPSGLVSPDNTQWEPTLDNSGEIVGWVQYAIGEGGAKEPVGAAMSPGTPPGAVVNGWTHGGEGWWFRMQTDENGNQNIASSYTGSDMQPPAE